MPDIAHKRTDDMIDELERKIYSEYNRAAKEVEGKMRAYLAKTEREAEKQRELLKAGKITKKDYTDWMTRKYAMGARWEELRDDLAGDMANANKIARSISNGYRADAYALNHNFAVYQAEHDGKCSTVYQLYDRQTVERLIEKDRDLMPPPGKKLAEQIRTGKVEKWNHQQLQSALTQSILQGEGIAETARRVARTVATRGYNDSVRYARTMMTGAENAGRNDGFKTAEDMGIELEKEWIATLDDRTRTTHALLHGERTPVDSIFSNGLEYPGDPAGADEEVWNCRCTMKASVKGFEHDRVESSPKMGDMTFDEWLESRGAWSEPKNPVAERPENEQDMLKQFRFLGVGAITEEEMLSRVNPNYERGGSREYTHNCQRCVVAMELQERGYDVEVMPYNARDGIGSNGTAPWKWAKGSALWYRDPGLLAAEKRSDIPHVLTRAAKEFGDGSRAIMRVQWMSKYGGSGHFWNVRFDGGKAVVLDPQNGTVVDLAEQMKYMTTGKYACWVARVDNREVSDLIGLAVKNREG